MHFFVKCSLFIYKSLFQIQNQTTTAKTSTTTAKSSTTKSTHEYHLSVKSLDPYELYPNCFQRLSVDAKSDSWFSKMSRINPEIRLLRLTFHESQSEIMILVRL